MTERTYINGRDEPCIRHMHPLDADQARSARNRHRRGANSTTDTETVMTERIHEPGNCVDPPYGNPWCSGIGSWGPNPYAAEIHNDHTPVFMCDGARKGSAMDI